MCCCLNTIKQLETRVAKLFAYTRITGAFAYLVTALGTAKDAVRRLTTMTVANQTTDTCFDYGLMMAAFCSRNM
jgi:hypothetical protein